MKAAVIYRYGPAHSFKINQVQEPSIGEAELLIKVKASSVNPVDWKIRQGKLKIITGTDFPKILGADFSGEIVEIGSPVNGYKIGDQVYGMVRAAIGGAYAEFLKVKAKNIAPKPEKLSHEEAAAIPLAGLTALQGLRDYGMLAPEQKVLINGASGGVGTYAVQIAKAIGANITGVCSTSNLQLVNNLGAKDVIDYKKEEVLKPGNQYHLIFDTIGNLSFSKAKECLYDGGILVSTLPSPKGILQFLLSKFTKHKGMKFFMLNPQKEDLMELNKLVDQDKIRSIIDSTFALEDIAQAHDRSEGGHARGKIVIKTGE